MTTAAADKVLWFVGPEPPRVEYTTSSGGESVFLRRDAAGQIWLLLQRDMLGREQADPDEFTYGPFGLLVQAAMRARAAGVALPPTLAGLATDAGPARRSGYSISQLTIRENALLAAGRRVDGLWVVAAAHQATWILALSPSRHPRLEDAEIHQ